MKKIILLAAVLLVGCDKEPESVQMAGSDFRVGKLFTVDGCTVYRFADGGRNVYFTNCPGQTNSSYSRNNGKNRTTSYDEVITNKNGSGS
ncbi:DUF4884 domain-containing protein [Pantoea sp. CCBC3-3-1]|uniref:DUF4884 domain-containing protein n=1 Tax=Pantoea sp. CCBC3-3-1 TaxID=2490851 RepID=UPI001C2B92AB|nr:DUF4884 domain-containing protein [Pantoea sp. CCBC3-3-1]